MRASKRSTVSAKPEVRLHKYQEVAIRFMVKNPGAGIFLDPGLGKTLCAYSAIDILGEAGVMRHTLVVAPLRPLYQTWPAELVKWGFDDRLDLYMLHGSKKEKSLLQGFKAKRPAVFLLNYEGLDWLFAMMNRHQLRFDGVVFDESSKLRNTSTRRFKMVRAGLPYFKRRYILTGTPAPKGLENLFGQIFVIDGGKALGQYVTHFRREFFDQDPFTPYPSYRLKAGADKEIYERIAPLVVRFDDSELDMPKRVDRVVQVELPKAARLLYQEIETTLLATLDERTSVLSKNAAVASHRLRQVANGGLYYHQGDERTWKNLHTAKTDALVELVEELGGQPTLVAYEFHHDLDRILKAYPNTPYIGGGVSPKRAMEIQAEWDKGNLALVLGQPQSMAHGLNFQHGGRAIIWHSLTWNYEDYIQFVRRLWRQGQTKRVFNYHLAAKDTVDEVILETSGITGTRATTQGQLFTALKNHMLQRRKGK